MDKNLTEKAAYILGGMLIGSGVTYLVVRKSLALKYRDIAEAEIASVKESYDLLYKQGKYSDPKAAMEALSERVAELDNYEGKLDENGYFTEEALEETEDVKSETPMVLDDGRPDPTEIVRSIIDDREDPPRYEGTTNPYVITVEEFHTDRDDFEKITVSYYEYDNTLASEDETIIHDHEKTIGSDFVNYIGWKSDSDHVVYVRNERISSDMEVLVHKGSYEEEVLGILPDDHPKKKMLKARNDE